jgi:hypothetical protein
LHASKTAVRRNSKLFRWNDGRQSDAILIHCRFAPNRFSVWVVVGLACSRNMRFGAQVGLTARNLEGIHCRFAPNRSAVWVVAGSPMLP